MKKYFKALFVALAAAVLFAVLGLAACGDKNRYNISVSCGDGGAYTLSHESPVPENTQVTLTVTPDDGYTVGDVLIDNSKVSLIGNKYIFTVTKDVSISISFESESGYGSGISGEALNRRATRPKNALSRWTAARAAIMNSLPPLTTMWETA